MTGNGDRPRAFGLVLSVSGLCIGCIAPSARLPRTDVPSPNARRADSEEILSQLVDAHNDARARASLPPLVVDARLEAAARRHANDMAQRRWMSHRGGDGSSPFQRMKAEGYSFRRAGENVAAGAFTLESLMTAWMRSPGHRRNILGSFAQIGTAYAIDGAGKSYWCVTFGTP
jgi:uncharacterized protein YkwD